MAGISDEKLQELRDRVDLAAVVQRRVQLKRSGRDLRGLCPFHGEKTPSFYVVPDKRLYHCFGCGKTGDAIKFLMELEGKSFRQAVDELAREAGIELTPEDPLEQKRAQRRSALAEVNEKACVFFERVLWEHKLGEIARLHLQKRGVTQETAKAWRLGYAPNLWDSLCKSLARSKVDPKLVDEAGLGVPRTKGRGAGTLYDRFRGRLIIPIREGGRTLAFGGRLLEGESEAKYLNSPETPLYQKGHVLFALDKAREGVRRDGVVLYTEGYFDAIGLHQAGIQTAVATCGTAMTERHLELVQRAGAKELVFVFDGDAAGIRAATRASELAAAAGVPARVLVPPDGEDPDETVARIGTEAFRELVQSAQPALEFLLDRALLAVGKDASIEARVRAVEAVSGIVRAAPSGLARDLYLEKVAQKLGAPLAAVRMAIEHAGEAKEAVESRKSRVENRSDGSAPGAPTSVAHREQRGNERDPREHQDPSGQTQRRAQGALAGKPAAQAIEPHRLEGRIELQIVASMLRNPTLCKLVEASGAASGFRVAMLREFAEQAFALANAGSLDANALVSAAEPAALREALQRQMTEMEQGAAETLEGERKHLQTMIDRLVKRPDFSIRHRRDAQEEVVPRKGQQSPKVAPSASSAGGNSGQKTGA